MEQSMVKWQRKIFFLCWAAYASAYLCRTNLSIATPEIMSSFSWNKTSVGLIGSSFFGAYAIGQLINGLIGDKLNSRYFIFTGLCVSSLVNFTMGFSSSLYLMIGLWAINGFCLSMLWGPIVKTLSYWFSYEKRTKVAVWISTSMIGGYLLAWGVIGIVIAKATWRWAFWIPSGLVFMFALLWVWKMRNHPKEVGIQQELNETKHEDIKINNSSISFLQMVYKHKLWLIALACIAQGVIKDGITLWAPTFLSETQNIGQEVLSFFSLAVPIMSLFGILCAGWLNKAFNQRQNISIIVLLVCAGISCLGLYFLMNSNIYICTVLLGLASAFTYGANTLLLTLIPLKFIRYNRVSGVAGFLDFFSYVGAGLTGIVTGLVTDKFGWNGIILSWVTLAVIGIVAVCFANKTED